MSPKILSVQKRLFRGFGAQTYSQAVKVIIRLAEVPLLLTLWQPDLYGEWLMLSAIPAYLSLGDAGFATTACREMAILSSARDREGTLTVFQSAWVLLIILSLIVVAIVFAFLEWTPLAVWFRFQYITSAELKIVVLALVVDVLVGFQSSLLNGGFWAVGRYPLGIGLTATIRLLGFTGLVLGVLLGGGPDHAALGYLLGNVLGSIIFWLVQRRVSPWIHYGIRYASFREIRRIMGPSFASLAFPLGNAFNIQGMRLIVGLTLGPAAVAVFVPLRTISNLAMQPRMIINQLIQPELAVAFGDRNDTLFRRIFLRSSQLALWGTLVISIILVGLGGIALHYWTAGKIIMQWPLFLIFMVGVTINGLWYTTLMVRYATNRHGRIALVYSGVYGLFAFILAFFLSRILGLVGTGLALLLTECIMAVIVIRDAICLSSVGIGKWASTVVQPPIGTMVDGMTRLWMLIKSRSVE
jgi:O-antigen/teichoic acid export membrane protein